jgi:signal transduction histidine kinase
MPRRALMADLLFAGVAIAAALAAADVTYHGLWFNPVIAALAATLPLVARRRFPLACFVVLLLAVLFTKGFATDLSFLMLLVAAYSAAMHSRFRGLALLTVALGGAVVAWVFWKQATAGPGPGVLRIPGYSPIIVGLKSGLPIRGSTAAPWRIDGLVALVATVGIAIVGGAAHTSERIRRLQAEHEAATGRALERERARIASELHDVVTHNVSVMIVQAGAARQVLDSAPADARAALLAVESSGRAAMAELRHLLGLLSPAEPSAPQTQAKVRSLEGRPAQGLAATGLEPVSRSACCAEDEPSLRPQPGVGRLTELAARMTGAGLPVELRLGDLPADLPPGVDLAAFRVVQEALTNVLKHAGKSATTVTVGYREGCVLVEVADSGRLMPAVGPVAVPGCGRGLLGLRERVSVYGGDLDAGPQARGGWRVLARIPVDPLLADSASIPDPPRLASPAGASAGTQ